ncbi:galactitol-specific phosphotransferase system IIC component [Lysinibacillus sp. RC46]
MFKFVDIPKLIEAFILFIEKVHVKLLLRTSLDKTKNYIGGIQVMKKILAALFAATLMFASVGATLFISDTPTAEAKSYKSGKKGFSNNNNNNNSSNFQKSQDKSKDQNNTTTNKSTNKTDSTAKKGGFFSGGLMKGLMLGGLAGLLFGSLFSGMGMLGNILGLLINVAAIMVIIMLVVKIVNMFKDKKRKEEAQWHK